MTLTAAMYAALPAYRDLDATSWQLPGTHSVGAFWNGATRQWDVRELRHELDLDAAAPLASYPADERDQAERHAHRAWRALLQLVG